MRDYTFRLGDTLDAVAARAGLAMSRVWEHPGNAKLRQDRKEPDLLFPRDVVVLPDVEVKELQRGTGAAHRFQVTIPRTPLQLFLLADGLPCKAAICTVVGEAGVPPATADDDGKVTLERPTALVRFDLEVRLQADPPLTQDNAGSTLGLPARTRRIPVQVGRLANEVAVLQARLTNLGFHCAVDGVFGRSTRSALNRFQKAFGLQRTETPDDQRTLAKLAELHDAAKGWKRRLTDEDKLCRSLTPVHHVLFARPNRIVLLEGPEVVIDAHMHVNSGHCCPLPLTWDKDPMLALVRPSRDTTSGHLLPALGKAEGAVRQVRNAAKGAGDALATATAGATAAFDVEVAVLTCILTQTLITAGYGARAAGREVTAVIDDAAGLTNAAAQAFRWSATLEAGTGKALDATAQRLREMVPDQAAPASARMHATSGLSGWLVAQVVNAYRTYSDARAEVGRKVANGITETAADAAAVGARGLEAAADLEARLAALQDEFASKLRRLSNDLDQELDLAAEDARLLVLYVAEGLRAKVSEGGARLRAAVRNGSAAAQETLAAPEAFLGAKRQFVEISGMNTRPIAARSVEGNRDAVAKLPRATSGERLSMMMAMPMDMDLGHLRGWEGRQVYEPVQKRLALDVVLRPVGSGGGNPVALPRRPLPPGTKRPLGRVPGIPMPIRIPAPNPLPLDYVVESTIVEEDGPFYYYPEYHEVRVGPAKRRTVVERLRWLPDREFKLYQDHPVQVKDTLAAAADQPWSVLPLFHYDPRRWAAASGTPRRTRRFRVAGGTEKEIEVTPQPWDAPFDQYFQDPGKRPFIGIKQYTALGYRPLDVRLPHQADFYARCVSLDLPIVCHCSAKGMYSLDRPLYALEETGGDPALLASLRKLAAERMRKRGQPIPERLDGEDEAFEKEWREDWFSEEYVSPEAWRKVLQLHPRLRLCLAHFGGDAPYTHWKVRDTTPVDRDLLKRPWSACQDLRWDDALVKLAGEYENVFVDLAYFVFDPSMTRFRDYIAAYPHLRDKLLFGTDWWMVEMDGFDYPKFVLQARKALDSIDPELWPRFSWINPVRFYRLRENADAIARSLRERAPEDPTKAKAYPALVQRGLDLLRALHPGAAR